MLTADEIFARCPVPVLWPSSSPILEIAIELLPTIEDDLAADLIEHIAVLLVDRDEGLHVMRELLSGAFAMTHTQHVEILRLQRRLADLLDDRRRGQPALYSVRPQARHRAGQRRPAPASTEEKSLYGKGRVETAQGSTAQHRHSTGHHRAGGPWT